MRTKLACLVAGAAVLLVPTPVWTHHAFSAEFDVEKPLTLKGTLVRWDMINPHSWFHLDIEDDDGQFHLRKHVVDMPPGTRRSVRVRADALGRWAFHCHLLYHMAAGRVREVRVDE